MGIFKISTRNSNRDQPQISATRKNVQSSSDCQLILKQKSSDYQMQFFLRPATGNHQCLYLMHGSVREELLEHQQTVTLLFVEVVDFLRVALGL